MKLIHLINSTFPSLKITFDTLIDVGNAKYQNIKTSHLKITDANIPVRFRAQQ